MVAGRLSNLLADSVLSIVSVVLLTTAILVEGAVSCPVAR